MKHATPLLLLLFLLLVGCGQKGPLYLPADEPAKPTESTPPPSADAVPADAAATESR